MRRQKDPEFGNVCDKIARRNLEEKQLEYLKK
jgi:hypothetical protein